jgi:site-specific DNA-methyltransferase (adenine-specific)
MPEQLLGRIIRVSSNPGDLVLDPFAGSGSTLVVAKKLGRHWLGFELSKNYANRIRNRLAEVSPGDSLEGSSNPQESAPRTEQGKALVRKDGSSIKAPAIRRASDLDSAILEAFVITHRQFPVDRLIADPELNLQFVDLCKRWGLPGEPFDWNNRLLNLRKTGQLGELPKSRRTTLTEEERDSCSYACEIVIQLFHERGISLDRLLCDPATSAEFDQRVRNIVGCDLPSLLMRWVALGIRKRAENARRKAAGIAESNRRLPSRRIPVGELDLSKIPSVAGLYWLENAEAQTNLYVGGTLNLQKRLETQILASKFDFWGTAKNLLSVRIREVEAAKLNGFQSFWIGQLKPRGNYCKLAAA